MTNTPSSLTVLGLSKSGCAVARHASQYKKECTVFLSEMLPGSDANRSQRDALTELGVQVEMGGHSQQCFHHSNDVVVSPGIPPTSAMVKQLVLSDKNVMSEVEYAWRESQALADSQANPQPRWIGVTGTNGKTTTVTGIEAILNATSTPAIACGNIGLPVTDCLTAHSKTPWWVVELSSFQLHFSPTLVPEIAVFLNLTPDHINWHGSFEAYKAAKLSLYLPKNNGKAPVWLVLNSDDPVSGEIDQHASPESKRVWFSKTGRYPSGAKYAVFLNAEGDEGDVNVLWDGELNSQPLFNVKEALLKGAHNHENVLAMVAAAYCAGAAPDVIQSVCKTFTGVQHRLEPVALPAESPPVLVVNDSKATNVNSTLAAIDAYSEHPMVLLMGGRLKNEPFEPLMSYIQQNVNGVVLYGESRSVLAEMLKKSGYEKNVLQVELLPEAAEAAFELTQTLIPEDVNHSSEKSVPEKPVLLFSPAAASFDQYRDFEARGSAFKETIDSLSMSLYHSSHHQPEVTA